LRSSKKFPWSLLSINSPPVRSHIFWSMWMPALKEMTLLYTFCSLIF
jgi:hypothetical protein